MKHEAHFFKLFSHRIPGSLPDTKGTCRSCYGLQNLPDKIDFENFKEFFFLAGKREVLKLNFTKTSGLRITLARSLRATFMTGKLRMITMRNICQSCTTVCHIWSRLPPNKHYVLQSWCDLFTLTDKFSRSFRMTAIKLRRAKLTFSTVGDKNAKVSFEPELENIFFHRELLDCEKVSFTTVCHMGVRLLLPRRLHNVLRMLFKRYFWNEAVIYLRCR